MTSASLAVLDPMPMISGSIFSQKFPIQLTVAPLLGNRAGCGLRGGDKEPRGTVLGRYEEWDHALLMFGTRTTAIFVPNCALLILRASNMSPGYCIGE